MNTKQLFEKKAALVNEYKSLDQRLKSENRTELTADEHLTLERVDKELSAVEASIKAVERINNATSDTPLTVKEPKTKERGYNQVFSDYVNSKSLSKEDKLILSRGTNTITTTTAGTTYGGYAVPEDFSNELNKQMAYYGPMMQVARRVNSTYGGSLPWPKVNDTAAKAVIKSEGAAVTTQDFTLTRVVLGAYTYTDQIRVSVEWEQDEGVNMISELPAMMGERFGRALNEHFTTGDGSSKPTGFVTDATTGETAAVSALTGDNMIDLIHSVDIAYRTGPNVGFQLNDATAAALRKLTVGASDDRYLWEPSYQLGQPDTIFGYKAYINPDMADIGASAKSVAFGDWSKYIIRQVSGFNVRRLDERYADELEVGFLAWARYDGKLLDTAAIKVIAHAAS